MFQILFVKSSKENTLILYVVSFKKKKKPTYYFLNMTGYSAYPRKVMKDKQN